MGRKKSDSGGRRAVRAMVQRLESLEQAGVTHLGKPGRTSSKGEPGAGGDDRVGALAEVRREVAACTRCKELARTRTQTVFGAGNPHARLVFVGEAPGADEDREGEPFVGAAGQLLTGLSRHARSGAKTSTSATSSAAARPATETRCPTKRPTAGSISTARWRSSGRSSFAVWARWPPKTCSARPSRSANCGARRTTTRVSGSCARTTPPICFAPRRPRPRRGKTCRC